MKKYINADFEVHVLSVQFQSAGNGSQIKLPCPVLPPPGFCSPVRGSLCPKSNLVDEVHEHPLYSEPSECWEHIQHSLLPLALAEL